MSILNKRKTVAVLLLISLIFSMLPCKDLAAKKKKKLKFNKTKISMKVGEDKLLKIKNNTKPKSVKWSTSNKKVVYFDSNSEQDCWLVARKAGTARITAKIGKVKLKCKVTVKKSRNTNGNNTSNSIPSPTPSTNPSVTPAPSSESNIKDNWNTLKNYILTQGYTANDGSRGINVELNNYNYVINYYSAEQTFKFSCDQDVSGSTSAPGMFQMKISENNLTYASLTYNIVYKYSVIYGVCTAIASIPVTNKNTQFAWTVVKGNMGAAQISNLANMSFAVAYTGWDILLMNTVGNNFTMEKLGFLPSPN